MEFTRIAGGDCGSKDCATIFTTDRDTVAIQGDIVERKTPDGEGVVEIPKDLLREAARALGW